MAYKLEQFRLAGGNAMEYVRRPGGDAPIVLIHGYADSWYSFKGVMDFLPANFAAFAPTLLGHGSRPSQSRHIPSRVMPPTFWSSCGR